MQIKIHKVIIRGKSKLAEKTPMLDCHIKFNLNGQDYCWTWLMVQPGHYYYSHSFAKIKKPQQVVESSIFVPTEEIKHEQLIGTCSECGGFSSDDCFYIYNKPSEWKEKFFELVSANIAEGLVEFDEKIK